MTCDPFEIVVVPFPLTDRQAVKRRPAVVVSSVAFNAVHQQAILAMITSAADEWPSDVALRDWREAGLSIPCKVRFKLFALDETLVCRTLGAPSKRDRKAIRNGLSRFLAIE